MPNHASHHHDGAGDARAGSVPTTNAAARPDQVPDTNRGTLRVRDCGTWSGSINHILATAAYVAKAGYQQDGRQRMARKGGTGQV